MAAFLHPCWVFIFFVCIHAAEIKVIVAGLGRTGTMSMQAALDILGYKTYHMAQFLENHSHPALWRQYSEGRLTSQELFGNITELGFNATMDNPMCDVFEEQMRLFPNAKVILTKHPKGAAGLSKSFTTLMEMVQIQSAPFSWTFPNFLSFIPFFQDINAVRCMMGTITMDLEPCALTYNWQNKSPGWLEKQYAAHNARVVAAVPSDDLLHFSVTDGWESLCNFLDFPVPDVPFPKKNDAGSIKFMRLILLMVVYLWIPFMAAIVFCAVRGCVASTCFKVKLI